MSIKPNLTDKKWLIASAFATLFWYISLFPGRISSDGVEAIGIILEGKSTDWWTAIYFWYLRITTFSGAQLWFSSLLSLLTVYFAVVYFIKSLPEKKLNAEKILFFFCLSPLFGNFAMTINHDTFFTSGILLCFGCLLRIHLKSVRTLDKYVPYLAILFLMNSKIGYAVIVAFVIFTLLRKSFITAIVLSIFTLFIYVVSSIGIAKSVVPKHYLPFLADLKCVAQHPEARIAEEEWEFLRKIAPEERWKEPLTCSNLDIALSRLRSPEQDNVNLRLDKLSKNSDLNRISLAEFFQYYSSLAVKNPAIVIQAHLQRSSIALPPPFFQGPQNQVDRDVSNPVGLNSNIALQQGPEVLHPSIDDPRYKLETKFLKPLENAALFSSFIINQASWFWGWGGLWLWPIFIYLLFRAKVRGIKDISFIVFPIVTTHLVLIFVGPVPLPRYVMSTILIGNIFFLFLISAVFNKTKSI